MRGRKHHFMFGLVLGVLLPFSLAQGQDLDALFAENNVAEYNGYRITRTFDKSEDAFGRSRTVIKRGKTTLARIDGYSYKNSTRFALFSVLGDKRKQLIVESYSGGAHCCNSYYIYDLTPRFRILFDGATYSPDDVGYSMTLIDLNNDGVFEFVQRVMNFDYFYASHAQSVFPEVVFAFDRRSAKYRPANLTFSSYLLRDIETKRQAAEKLNNNLDPAQAFGNVGRRQDYHNRFLDVTLTYIFAGKETEGWHFFDQNYKLPNKRELRADVKRMLNSSSVYRSLGRT